MPIMRTARLALCAVALGLPFAPSAHAEYPERAVSFIAQAAPGSGFDTVTRAVATTMQQEGLIKVPMPVTNFPSSAAGMQNVVTRHANDPYMVSFQSLSAMMRYATGSSEYSHEHITPLARLISDYYVVAVRADSEMKTLKDFLDALKANPKAFPITGGQSDDRIFYGLMFTKYGIDPTQINYVAFSGGGEASAILLEGSAKALISTLSDIAGLIKSGQVRALAVSGKKLTGDFANIPTLKESGIDIEWQNFRYALGGPNMPPEAVAYWRGKLKEMVKTKTWKDTLERNRWGDEFLIEGFDTYLDDTQNQILDIARTLGVAKR
jgi:putative tricarboxylic transport membrane protein